MKVTRPHDPNLTPEELQELERLKTVISRVVADGRVFGEELETIRRVMGEDGKVGREELNLLRTLVLEKIQKGELQQIWD
jgi:hypothetical protein